MLSFAWILLLTTSVVALDEYKPTWSSLDARPLPPWYDEAKVGIFLHWGVFSVPSYVSEWFWWYWLGQGPPSDPLPALFMAANYPPRFTYPEFAKDFTCEFFDPYEWARLFKKAGARYVVLTTKHHEGFTLWPSSVTFNWNARDVGPKRDLVGDLSKAIRSETDIHFGVYHSLFEWFNPLYLKDKAANFTTDYFAKNKTLVELYELVNTYKPDVVWSDGDAGPDTYWKSKEFLAWLYNTSPVKDVVVTNDRWGTGTSCRHGGFYSCEDRYDPGKLQPHKWENAMTLDRRSWGYRRDATLADIYRIEDLIALLAKTVSCGGNILINVGPTSDGRIAPIYQERFTQLGQWLKVNGEAIYSTTPWVCQNDSANANVWYTSKPDGRGSKTVYVIVLKWPKLSVLELGSLTVQNSTVVTMLGTNARPHVVPRYSGTVVKMPDLTPDLLPTPWAWVLKVTGPAEGYCPHFSIMRTTNRDIN
ncbi:alpha-L-fucosidase-like [Ornithodoros turicata]|uniref:alpha-L-fucosidase-like n=1 Tax=Ornithodoros turicata TaxID=34597 RepID=UPI003139091F